MAQQHKYTAEETITRNVGRVDRIILLPHSVKAEGRDGRVEVYFLIGEETGGVFTERTKSHAILGYADLPGSLQTLLDDLETKALNYGSSNGILPAGAVEDVPDLDP